MVDPRTPPRASALALAAAPATYQFRVFATVGKVPGEPCQPVGLTIH